MTTQMIICMLTFLLMIISFALNKFPLGVTGGAALVILLLTGCIEPSVALTKLGSANVIIIVGMFVIGAGLKKLSIIDTITRFIRKVTGGSFIWSYRALIVLAFLLTSFITSPVVCYAIAFPLLDSVCDEYGESRSKYQFPLAVVCIACCAILPFGFAISQAAVFSGFMESYGFTQEFTAMDFTRARWPMAIIVILWAFFLAYKFTPEKPVMPINDSKGSGEQKKLGKIQDILGSIIFVGTMIGLVFNAQLGIDAWVVVFTGCILNVICGVLTGKEAIQAMAIDLGIMFIGANSMAQALVNTGSAEFIGNKVSELLGASPSGLMLYIVFFVVPFILTQFMQNQGVMNIFAPIALIICSAIGADPKGCLVLVCAGSLTAFMTPSATPAIPMAMGAGGYDVKSLVKGSWPLSVMLTIGYIAFVSFVMPAF